MQFAEKFPKENMESFKDHKVPVPHLVVEDGCFSLNFSKKRCLQRVADGLQRYQVYLEFVEKEFPQQSRVRDIMNKASSLVHIIREKEKTVQLEVLEPAVKKQLLGELPSSSRWSRSISVHGVLSRMSAFAADAFRAIRYINQRLRRGRP
ncbi:interleukin-6 [Scleropages formosus]|uniref:interleukin-6 n=1 Tax=Scleropages formosus TaxID=113540 RepID=UPI0010FA76F5|nr:interleukin-6 [Scleropages formosus]